MRIVLVLVVLLLAACEGSFVQSGDLGRKVNIDKTYEARDACLSRNAAADGASAEDPGTLAHAVALACSAETDKLIAASDLSGDAKVAPPDPSRQRVQGPGLRHEGAWPNDLLGVGGSGRYER